MNDQYKTNENPHHVSLLDSRTDQPTKRCFTPDKGPTPDNKSEFIYTSTAFGDVQRYSADGGVWYYEYNDWRRATWTHPYRPLLATTDTTSKEENTNNHE